MPPKPDLNNSLKIENEEKSLAIPSVKAKLLEGKRGLIVGIANENSIAWGCAKAFHAFGAELAVTYLNDKARRYVEPLAQAVEAQIVMPLDVRAEGQLEAVFERIAEQWGFRRTFDRVLTERRIARPCRRRLERRISDDHGGVLLDLHPHGTPGRTADAQGRHALYDDLLRQPNGREELQHHGRCQGRARERRALPRRRAWA